MGYILKDPQKKRDRRANSSVHCSKFAYSAGNFNIDPLGRIVPNM